MLKTLPIEKLKAGENIRSETDTEFGDLLESLEEYGQLQPLLVVRRDGYYEVVAGHRRFNAIKTRNEPFVECNVLTDVRESQIPFIQLIENVQRLDLKPWEYVKCFDAMKRADPRLTHETIGRKIGKASTWVQSQYSAAAAYEKLVADGIEPEVLEVIPPTTLRKLNNVKKKKHRKKAAKAVSEGAPAETVTEQKSYRKAQEQERRDDSENGVAMRLYDDDRKLIFLCNDPQKAHAVKREIREVLRTVDYDLGALTVTWSDQYGGLRPLPLRNEIEDFVHAELFSRDIQNRLEELGFSLRTLRFHIVKSGSEENDAT